MLHTTTAVSTPYIVMSQPNNSSSTTTTSTISNDSNGDPNASHYHAC